MYLGFSLWKVDKNCWTYISKTSKSRTNIGTEPPFVAHLYQLDISLAKEVISRFGTVNINRNRKGKTDKFANGSTGLTPLFCLALLTALQTSLTLYYAKAFFWLKTRLSIHNMQQQWSATAVRPGSLPATKSFDSGERGKGKGERGKVRASRAGDLCRRREGVGALRRMNTSFLKGKKKREAEQEPNSTNNRPRMAKRNLQHS